MAVKFKLHVDGTTVDLALRISAISNGWVIKAGAAPYFCFTEEELLSSIEDLVKQFTEQTVKK